jgi:outer membrane cobalamin receptor
MLKSESRSQKLGKKKPTSLACRCLFGLRSVPTVCLTRLLMFCLCVGAARAGTLEGTVLDPSGRAVPGARVSLLRSLVALEERQTDARGAYSFAGLRSGTYRLVANASGFSSASTAVEVRDAGTQTVDLQLELSAVEQQVVVSASLAGVLAPQIGSSVSVINQEEIDDRGAQSVLEVLRGVPGVEVNQTGRRGGATGVFLRGGNSNYNLVMIDGMQVNQFGGNFDFAPIPADGVDHVEVTRGPESALYGSNAVTGVINIVTRRGEGRPHFTAQAEGGSFTTRRFATGGSGLSRGLSWGYDLSRLDSGGTVDNDRFRNQSAFLSLGYRRSDRRRVDFHFFGNANDAGAPGPYGSDPDHLYDAPIYPGGPTNRQLGLLTRDKQNLFGYQGSYAEQLSSRFRQVVSGGVTTNNYYFISPLGDSFSNNLRGVLNTRSEVIVSSKDFLVAGFEYNHEQIKNTYIADASNQPFLLPRTSLAYFAENRWSPTGRLFVTAGLRLDDLRTHALPPDAFGSRPLLPADHIVQLNPHASVAYILRESRGGWLDVTRLHGGFGTGIRAPSGFELAFTNNPHLKPEKSLSFDSGVEQRFLSSRAVLDVTYFYSRFKDQIVVLGGSLTNLSTFMSANLANSRAQGMEMSFRLRPARSVELAGVYTLLATSIRALDGTTLAQFPFQVGQPLLRRPRDSGAYNLTWHHGRLMLNTNAYIRGAVLDLEPNDGTFACSLGLRCLFTNPRYVRADGGFSYRLPHGVEIYGRLNNFLNRRYEESLGFPALPFNFLAGVKFSFPAE